MKLMMYLGNDFIESIHLDTEKISLPGYVGKHTRHLKEKYAMLVAMGSEEPQFLVLREKYLCMN